MHIVTFILVAARDQLAPLPVKTRGMVRRMIFQSSASDQLSMYCMSIFIQVSKSMESLPATAHKQVSPGRMRSRRRCQRWYISTSSGPAGRGPTNDMSPLSTFHNCGHSSMENLRKNQPRGVSRGSLGILKAVDLRLRCITEAFRTSALSHMERNL